MDIVSDRLVKETIVEQVKGKKVTGIVKQQKEIIYSDTATYQGT